MTNDLKNIYPHTKDFGVGVYAEKTLEEIPRLLSNLDRNPFSPTYGCFNREFWLTRTRDFPDAIAQFGTLSLALVWTHKIPGGEQYYQNKEIKEWAIAGIKYWIKIQHKDGSYDEFYPNERGWAGPTGFLLYAMLRSYEALGDQFPEDLKKEFFQVVERSARFLATREESGVLANHHAMALLPVCQAIYHLKKQDVSVKELAGNFKERLDVFFSHCYEEGWSLEYDGTDPGYLSATVSFLSKMQKYMSGKEEWADRIQETIDKAVDFTSYFFYPNGSYAGTMGSRQTLHFYAHGYELQASKNPLAAAMAECGLHSLSEGKLVPPSIQDDRYYLYRIPELLEAYIDHAEKAEGLPALPFQKEEFDKYFPEAKIYIKNTAGYYILLNLAKGGVLKVYDKNNKKLAFSDDGIVLETKKGKVLTTQWIGQEYKIENTGNQWVVYGNFHKIPYKYFNPITFMGFRSFMLLTGWNARLAEWVKGLIRNLLMTRSSRSKMSFERRFTFENNEITVMSLINAQQIKFLRIGGQFAPRYVPQSRYFQQEELDNNYWQADDNFLSYLNKNKFNSLKGEIDLASNGIKYIPTEKPLKIAIAVNGRAHESGATTLTNNIADGLRDIGAFTRIYTIFGESRYRDIKISFVKKSEKKLNGKPILTIVAYYLSKIMLSLHLYIGFLKNKYSHIFCIDMSAANASIPLKKLFGTVVVHFPIGEVSKELAIQGKIRKGGWSQKILQREERKAFLRSNINETIPERLPHILSIADKASIEIIPHGAVNIHRFYPDNMLKQEIRQKMNIDDKFILMFVGRLVKRKGPIFPLLGLIDLVKKGNKNYHLLYIGTGPEEENLKKIARENDIQEHTTFMGSVSHVQMGNYMRAANCLIFSSSTREGIIEPFTFMIMEAFASGVPVIALKTKTYETILRDRYNCILVEEDNVSELIQAINLLNQSYNLKQKLCSGGLDTLNKGAWTTDLFAQKIISVADKYSST